MSQKRKPYSPRLRNPRDVRRYLARIVHEIEQGQIEPKVGNSVIYACNVLLGCMKKGEFEQRLADLEQLIIEKVNGDMHVHQ